MENERYSRMKMGERLRGARERCGYTREKLAELVDISPQFLANIELGTRGLSFRTLERVCTVLGVSCDYLVLGRTSDAPDSSLTDLLAQLDERYYPMAERMLRALIEATRAAEEKNFV